MTKSLESPSILPNQHIQAAQNHAARLAMSISGILYEEHLVDGTYETPLEAAIRMAKEKKMSDQGVRMLIDAGIVIS